MKYTIKDLITDQEGYGFNHILGLDLDYILKNTDVVEELEEAIQEYIQEEEVIYHKVAMEFLTEEDQSLSESMGLAEGMGYEVGNINSELLATLLLRERLMEELPNLIELLTEKIEELEEAE